MHSPVGAGLPAKAALRATNLQLTHPIPVGAAEGCDLLILLLHCESERQKIAAFGSSYSERSCV
jgi:hypothetical protein